MKYVVATFLAIAGLFLSPDLLAGKKSENGVFRPTLSTNAKKYLREFPLNRIAADEILQYIGTPDKTMSLGGSDFVTYDISSKQHANGVIEYTFEIKDGVVVNVTYLNSGNFFGVTQRESARELQSP